MKFPFQCSDIVGMSIGLSSGFGLFRGFGLSQLQVHQSSIAQSLERLSTGKRINRASDDPSGMIASTKMNAQLYSLEKKIDGFDRETSWLGAREGALSVLSDFMVELNGYTVQAANTAGMTPEEREGIEQSIASVLQGINTVVNTTTFGGERVLTGFNTQDLGKITSKPIVGEDGKLVEGNTTSLSDLGRLIAEDPELAQSIVESASAMISGNRAAIGNRLKSIDSEKAALRSEFENISEALSLIEDTDFAKETAELVRSQILEQATIAAIKIGQQNAAQILDLIVPMSKIGPV